MAFITSDNPKSSEVPLYWRYWLGEINSRWVAVFRIVFSILLLKDAIYHLFLAQIWYSDTGVLPRAALFDGLLRDYRFSLMDAIGLPEFALAFFVVWIIVLVCLLVGYRVRLMTILNFIIILSIHERNIYVLTASDTLLRAMSFWIMFAPVGQYYSLDALWRRKHSNESEDSQTAFALPVRLMQWQLIIVYMSTAYLKTIGPIWTRGEVMHYIAQLDTMLLPIGQWMATWPSELLILSSYYALIAEILIPFLLLMPLYWRWARVLAFVLAIALHGGIGLVLGIPDFSYIMLLCFLPFFDPAWLEWLELKFKTRLASLNFDNWLPRLYRNSEQGEGLSFRLQSMLLAAFLIPFFILMLWWNVSANSQFNDNSDVISPIKTVISEPPASNFIRLLGMWQYWNMFSPLPIQYDGWFVIAGEFKNGEERDLVSNLPIDYSRPNRWYWGPEMRWEKWEETTYNQRPDVLLGSWAAYYCRLYENREVGQRLARLEIRMIITWLHAPNAVPNEQQEETLWFHWCFEEYAPQD